MGNFFKINFRVLNSLIVAKMCEYFCNFLQKKRLFKSKRHKVWPHRRQMQIILSLLLILAS